MDCEDHQGEAGVPQSVRQVDPGWISHRQAYDQYCLQFRAH